ncbi:hypothetical protein [Psychromonas sp.]|uniref:hypothetical protein n=1 Tax=Psychromonas sp. TaxID=1884585 RepID=UPI003A97F1E5
MSHLILHIGSHKTGTSSLQSSLLKNKAKLAELNWQFNTLDKFGNSSTFIKSEYKKGRLVRSLSTEFKSVLKHFQEQNLIISGEHFSLLGKNDESVIKKIQSLTAKYFKKTTIVLYLRRQDKLALSLKQQAAKGSALGQMVSSQLCGHSDKALPELTDDMTSYLSFNENVRVWASYFGKESLRVRLFEKEQLVDGDICADFSELINLPFKLESLRVNEGVTRQFSLCSHLLLQTKLEPKLIIDIRNKIKKHPTYSKEKIEVAKADAFNFYQHFKKDNDALLDWLGSKARFNESFDEYPENSNYRLTQDELTLLLETIASCSEQGTSLSIDDINSIRDGALALEKVDLAKASSLMSIALKLRPSGKLIKQKLVAYRKLLMLG